MKLLVVILNREEYLDQVLEVLVEVGVPGATVLDSVGMGRVLAYDVPIFAGFRDLMPDSRPFNKTILSIMDDALVPEAVAGIERVMGDLSEPGTGVVCALNIDFVKGLGKGF